MKSESDLARLMNCAGRYKYLSYLSWLLSAVSALLALGPFAAIWAIIRNVLDSRYDSIVSLGWLAVLLAVASMLIYIAALMCSHLAAFRVASNLRKTLLAHIARLPLGFVGKFGSGRLRKIINESSGAAETYLAHQLPDKAGALATPAGLLAMLLFFDWRLGLLSLVPVVLAFAVMMTMTGARMKRNMGLYQDALMDMSNQAVEYVRGIPVVKTFGQTIFSFRRFKDAIDRYEKFVIAYTKDLMTPMLVYTGAVNSSFAFIIAGAFLLAGDGISRTEILNVIFYVVVTPVISVTLTKIMFKSEESMIVHDALTRIDSVLSQEVQEQPACPAAMAGHDVCVDHVTFSYDGKKKALDDVSLVIGSGQKVALVGPSGGGKTTLASLIARFFDVQEGSIRIGGADVRSVPPAELMRCVSFVFQDSRLVKGTVRDNVKLGRPEADDGQVMEALRRAECMDIIGKLPLGLDTPVGSGGIHLSGGECQRLAIARTILKDSPVIILDEATSFSDPDNEVKIQKAFTGMLEGRTVIMIAHRLTSIVNTDRIFVLDSGKVVEEGSFEELLEHGGLFSRMWNEYSTSIEWKVERNK